MKKFRIIEAGRSLSHGKLVRASTGGCSTFIGCGTHDDCTLGGPYTTCRPAGSYAYEHCSAIGHGTTCSVGQRYESCGGGRYVSCPATKLYSV